MRLVGGFKEIMRKALAGYGFKIIRLTPMEKAVFALTKRGVKLENLDAIELFAYVGTWHTLDYARRVKTLDAWEFDQKCEVFLRKNLPMAEIKITDSFQEIRKTDKKYGFIVADAPRGIYGENNEYCDHFALFPYIFHIMQDECILILNVTTKLGKQDEERYPYLVDPERVKRSGKFYQSDHPNNLTFEEMAGVYSKYADENGFNLEWFFPQQRTPTLSYLVMKLRKV